ncbi:RNA-directed DNA polymerase, eukaryota [Tanacetum coccineum]
MIINTFLEPNNNSSSDEEDECENEGSLNGDKNDTDKEVDRVSESSCMHGDALFYDNSNNKSMASKAESGDPFNLYDILNKNKENDGISKEGELKYLPGFTLKEATVDGVQEKKIEDGECVIMGDFNEVHSEQERYGLVFNVQSVIAFNNFISLASLVDLPLDCYSFTWAHKSATKMSKLDRFLISKGLMASFPHLLALCLDKHLSDHRPILMPEMNIDYDHTPFILLHS